LFLLHLSAGHSCHPRFLAPSSRLRCAGLWLSRFWTRFFFGKSLSLFSGLRPFLFLPFSDGDRRGRHGFLYSGRRRINVASSPQISVAIATMLFTDQAQLSLNAGVPALAFSTRNSSTSFSLDSFLDPASLSTLPTESSAELKILLPQLFTF